MITGYRQSSLRACGNRCRLVRARALHILVATYLTDKILWFSSVKQSTDWCHANWMVYHLLFFCDGRISNPSCLWTEFRDWVLAKRKVLVAQLSNCLRFSGFWKSMTAYYIIMCNETWIRVVPVQKSFDQTVAGDPWPIISSWSVSFGLSPVPCFTRFFTRSGQSIIFQNVEGGFYYLRKVTLDVFLETTECVWLVLSAIIFFLRTSRKKKHRSLFSSRSFLNTLFCRAELLKFLPVTLSS